MKTTACVSLLPVVMFLLICLPSSALADSINYVLTSGMDRITFTLPQQPVPLGSCELYGPPQFEFDCFSLMPVAVTIDGVTDANANVNFYTPADGGGLTIVEGSTVEVNNDGPGKEQLFTGALSNPTLETFSNLQLVAVGAFGPAFNESFVLNAASAVPEPSYLIFLGAGLIGLAWSRARLQSK
jgi:hypothetical protein